MDWSNWFTLALAAGDSRDDGSDIRLDATFRTHGDELRGICWFKAGLSGGVLQVRPSSGRFPKEHRWPPLDLTTAAIPDPTRHCRVTDRDLDTGVEWHLRCLPQEPARPWSDCIDGRLQVDRLARLAGHLPPCAVEATFAVAADRIRLLGVLWDPGLAESADLAALPDTKRLVMEALLRRALHRTLGGVAGSARIDIPPPRQPAPPPKDLP